MENKTPAQLGWKQQNAHFVKTYDFKDFRQALAFINAVGDFSESQSHHPKITNCYNQVVLELWTHDEDSLTQKDRDWIVAFEEKYDGFKGYP